ncbi:hypothetical protein BOTCAL_0147g00020 [Botryotinia calthae]|uniref:Uncharacterized protein n=1 Tax=Botryotinia calthae TaxID=38488 RepID=A0A4Y8D2J2_9HELO|nr:hypothetical protein BOTCAL_0147g00020 [Botryotinia calthae]
MPTPEEIEKAKRDRKGEYQRGRYEKMRTEDPEGLKEKTKKRNRTARESLAKLRVNGPEAAGMKRDKRNKNQRDIRVKLLAENPDGVKAKRAERYQVQKAAKAANAALLISDPKAAEDHRLRNNKKKEKACQDLIYWDPRGDPELGRPRPDHSNAFAMTDIGTSLPHSTPTQSANSRSDLRFTSYYNSGLPTNNSNPLVPARDYGSARPVAGYESAGFGTSFASPISGHYDPSSMNDFESSVPSSTPIPTANSGYGYTSEETNDTFQWWQD